MKKREEDAPKGSLIDKVDCMFLYCIVVVVVLLFV
jgi:hypothetical protein